MHTSTTSAPATRIAWHSSATDMPSLCTTIRRPFSGCASRYRTSSSVDPAAVDQISCRPTSRSASAARGLLASSRAVPMAPVSGSARSHLRATRNQARKPKSDATTSSSIGALSAARVAARTLGSSAAEYARTAWTPTVRAPAASSSAASGWRRRSDATATV
ncbi:MAG: hypothetical protein AUI10_09980 [Actinobacteria bacterium 13_2_20CM_2_72_6]|nr:MAG: hypothetical protein AUI10_09980 [Actinobacteria bacterium 13_2_20CM_2_72_6]